MSQKKPKMIATPAGRSQPGMADRHAMSRNNKAAQRWQAQGGTGKNAQTSIHYKYATRFASESQASIVSRFWRNAILGSPHLASGQIILLLHRDRPQALVARLGGKASSVPHAAHEHEGVVA